MVQLLCALRVRNSRHKSEGGTLGPRLEFPCDELREIIFLCMRGGQGRGEESVFYLNLLPSVSRTFMVVNGKVLSFA